MDIRRIRSKLMEEQQAFLDDLRPEYIIPALLENNVVTAEEGKKLSEVKLNRKDRVKELLDIMYKKNIDKMKHFLKALRIDKDGCSPYPWLADCLEKRDDLSVEAYKTLVNGNIPFPVNNLINRDDRLDELRSALKKASETQRHWVVMHGPFGSGKTVLAAEAVRNNDLVENIFPDGIYWIHIGTYTRCEEKEEIKKRLKTLLNLMDCEPKLHDVETISDLNFYLRKKMVKRKKTLVILDAVWSKEVIDAFNIGCTILVTTNQKNITNGVSEFVSPIDCQYDLKEHEVMSLISKYVNIPVEEMPIVPARSIRNKCEKSPLVTSLIGLCLADVGREFWAEFDEKLEKKGLGTVRKRHASGDYKKDIKTLVNLSLESIKDLKKYYQDFLIFAKDIPVPNEVLEILWGIKAFEVKDIMDELHLRCFVEKVKIEGSKYPSYIPHDIYLDVLKEDIQNINSWIKSRHEHLINQLQILPSGAIDLTSFPKHYLPHTICYHLSKAEQYDLLENVCCNLRFIEQKIHLTEDPEYLYIDYHLYRNSFKHPALVQKFEDFVRKNSINICKKADIIQLALFEPVDSIVYQKAKEFASLPKRLCYDWCNRENNDIYANCKIRESIEKEIKYAAFNTDGSLVATVGDTFALIYFSLTGVELRKLCGHSDAIVHCAFNSIGDKLATASEDKTVKIFKIDESSITNKSFVDVIERREDNSILTFREHDEKLVCCQFSPDDSFIISGDILGIIYVWMMNPCETRYFLKHKVAHESLYDELKYSSFSCDGTMFGACNNSVIKIWQLQDDWDAIDFSSISCELPILNFCFSRDNTSVLCIINNDIFECNIKDGSKRSILGINCSSSYVITACCLSPDGSYLAYGTSDNYIIIICVHSGNVVAHFQSHNDLIINVMFSRDGKKLLSVSSSRYIIHDTSLLTDTPLKNFANNLSVQQDEEDIIIASSNYYNSIEVRKGLEGKLLACSEPSEESISACSLSPNCKEVVYGTITGSLKVFNLDSKNIIECCPLHTKRITYILHSKSNPTFFTCSEDNTIGIWKEVTNLFILKGHSKSVLMCQEFPTGDKLLSCSKDGTMKVWNTENGELLLPINEGHGNADVRFCDISPNGDLLASASSDETLKVWRSINGERRKDFKEEVDVNASVKCCRFLPKKNLLVSGHDNGKVKLWFLSGKLPVEIFPEPHDSPVCNILFQKDDPLKLLTLSYDIKLWHDMCLLQKIILPSSSMGSVPPNIWASDDFDVIVVILNNILYILKKILS